MNARDVTPKTKPLTRLGALNFCTGAHGTASTPPPHYTKHNASPNVPHHGTMLRTIALLPLIVGLVALCCIVPSLKAGSMTLRWDPPTTNSDGTSLNDLAGYNIYYGITSRTYTTCINVGNVTTTTVIGLQDAQTYYFSCTAYNTSSNESDYADELIWTAPPLNIPDHLTWASISTPQTVGVPFPVSIQAKDTNSITAISFAGIVNLSGFGAERRITIGTGTSTFDYPMHAANDDARMQILYLTNEIGRACMFKAFALNVGTVPGQTLINWTIRIKHTALNSYGNDAQWESEWTTVYQGNVTVTSTGWIEFPFIAPFYYGGTSNLLIDFSFNNTTHSRSGYCLYTTTSASRMLYTAVDSTSEDSLPWLGTTPKGSISKAIPNIRLQVSDVGLVNPTTATGFVSGIWTGSIMITYATTGIVLMADDGAGHRGISLPFDLVFGQATPLELSMYPDTFPPVTDSFVTNSSGESIDTASPIPPNIAQANASGGIPPVVYLVMEVEGFKMGIKGTVGADIQVQISTNLANPLAWEPLQNLLLTNIAPTIDGIPRETPQNTLEVAFAPAFEWFALSAATASSSSRFFRVAMPYNYAVLADKVLKSKGYQTRLIVARLPGETLHDVCYVGEDEAYIDYSGDHYILALNYSGATIREIADDYSTYVSMNWTSASEFVFTNGVRQLISTVVKTESPSLDPPLANTQTSIIAVDF